MSSSYRLTLENWLKELDVDANFVLDIGGSQLPVKGRTKSWQVKDYKIADLKSPHVNSPQPDLNINLNYSLNYDYDELSFDVIFCLEVFEYVFDPHNAFKIISQLLSNNGIAWVTFPSFYPMHQPIEDDCLRYMPSGIRKLAESVGLEIVEMIRRRPETDALLHYFSAERLRAAKGEDHLFMGWIVEMRKKP